jgi:DNA mismatch endonuclease (patch repair protein)
MDTLTAAERSVRMAKIRSKDTLPELRVRQLVHRLGYRFRLHQKDLPGRPDLVFTSRRKVIFVHGCFWHAHGRCKTANQPKSRRGYWKDKFARNKARDQSNARKLRNLGWKVLVIWECQTRSEALMLPRLRCFLEMKAR